MPKRKTRELGSEQQMGMKLLLPDIPQAQCSAGWVPQSGQDWLPEVVEESWVKGVHEKQCRRVSMQPGESVGKR